MTATEDLIKMVNELVRHDPEDGEKRMTNWEVGFIGSMAGYDEGGGHNENLFYENQEQKIKEIWNSIFG